MFKRTTITALVFGMVALAPPAAQAQQNCGSREKFVSHLAEKYKEVSQGVGVSSPTQVVEFWASEDTGTFSIFVTYPNGISCIIATGNNWTEAMAAPAAVDPAL